MIAYTCRGCLIPVNDHAREGADVVVGVRCRETMYGAVPQLISKRMCIACAEDYYSSWGSANIDRSGPSSSSGGPENAVR